MLKSLVPYGVVALVALLAGLLVTFFTSEEHSGQVISVITIAMFVAEFLLFFYRRRGKAPEAGAESGPPKDKEGRRWNFPRVLRIATLLASAALVLALFVMLGFRAELRKTWLLHAVVAVDLFLLGLLWWGTHYQRAQKTRMWGAVRAALEALQHTNPWPHGGRLSDPADLAALQAPDKGVAEQRLHDIRRKSHAVMKLVIKGIRDLVDLDVLHPFILRDRRVREKKNPSDTRFVSVWVPDEANRVFRCVVWSPDSSAFSDLARNHTPSMHRPVEYAAYLDHWHDRLPTTPEACEERGRQKASCTSLSGAVWEFETLEPAWAELFETHSPAAYVRDISAIDESDKYIVHAFMAPLRKHDVTVRTSYIRRLSINADHRLGLLAVLDPVKGALDLADQEFLDAMLHILVTALRRYLHASHVLGMEPWATD